MSNSQQVQAICPVFGKCGGCSYQDRTYEQELRLKQQAIKDLFSGVIDDQSSCINEIIASPKEYYYRNRIDLKVVRTKDERILVGFSPIQKPKGERQPFGLIPVETCYIAQKEIADAIPSIQKHIKETMPPKYRRGNITVRTGEKGDVFWGGIGKKSLQLSVDQYFSTTINGRTIHYSLDTFFQSNLSILPEVFKHIGEMKIMDKDSVFLDLYGGVGLFSVGLADWVSEVYLIEESVTSIAMARYNKKANGLDNINILEGKVEDRISSVLQQVKKNKKVVMIDPPRKGLSDKARNFMVGLKDVDHLLYLSCNPQALARDLTTFKENQWKIVVILPFDFFPRTPHIETLCLLEPKK